MKKISIALAQDVATAFPKLVDLVRSKNVDIIHVHLAAFEGSEHLLYPTLWYVISHNKRIEIVND